MKQIINKAFTVYLLKFLGCFCLLYYGTKAWIGITIPGGYYSYYAAYYLDYISVLRQSLLYGAKVFLLLFGYHSNIENTFYLSMVNGRSIHMVYSCLGYGISSFWVAFIFANEGDVKKKLLWIICGVFLIWIINVTRISMLLLAINNNWHFPLGLNHHTWFNIVAYASIFAGIIFYDRSTKKRKTTYVSA